MSCKTSVVTGDVLSVLRGYPDNSFDGLLCDPPYGFSFMGKKWDYDVPSVDIWRECLRVLKPGALLLAFGGARTQHRIATGIEDAGFELRDCLMWLYAKGFPKSQNISKAIDKAAGAERPVIGERTLTGNAAISTKEKGGTYGVQVGSVPAKIVPVTGPATDEAKRWDGYGTALKPAYEPVILARKPLEGTMVQNIRKWGTGGLAIDACRIETDEKIPAHHGTNGGAGRTIGKFNDAYKPGDSGSVFNESGRWPANVLFDEAAAACLGQVVGPRDSNPYRANEADGAVLPLKKRSAGGTKQRGLGPSRFFFSPKVSTKEREAGCEALEHRNVSEMLDREEGSDGLESPRSGARNHHPTLKPIGLTEYLARLILPPTECPVLLVPFSGAGSEMIGATQAGWPAIVGIEQDASYVEIANARIAHWFK